jgi:hypothetical protein
MNSCVWRICGAAARRGVVTVAMANAPGSEDEDKEYGEACTPEP